MSAIPPERWARMEALLDGALDRPKAERSAWLAAECAEDPALRAARLRLTDAVRRTLSNGLTLLGIASPTAM